MEKFFAEQPGGGFGNLSVLAPVVVFGPAVEMEMDDGRFIFPLNKDRPGVARPAAVRRVRDESDLPQIHADVLENPARKIFVPPVPDDEADFLAGGNYPRHLAVNPRDVFKLARPVACVVRPAQPRRLVLFPFGGKRKAKFGGLVAP